MRLETTLALAGVLFSFGALASPVLAQEYTDDFETGNFAPFWSEIVGNIEINNSPSLSHAGSHSAHITYLKDEDRGHTFGPADLNTEHVYMRWYEYFADGFDFPLTLKTSLFMGKVDGLNRFEIYLITWGDPLNDAPGEAANNIGFVLLRAVDKRIDSGVSLRSGRWYCLEEEIKLNTPGRSDGILRLWIDGRLVIDESAINVRGSETVAINSMWTGGNYSNSNAGQNPTPDPARPSHRYMDDFVIRADGVRIGCAGGTTNSPPATPQSLQRGDVK